MKSERVEDSWYALKDYLLKNFIRPRDLNHNLKIPLGMEMFYLTIHFLSPSQNI